MSRLPVTRRIGVPFLVLIFPRRNCLVLIDTCCQRLVSPSWGPSILTLLPGLLLLGGQHLDRDAQGLREFLKRRPQGVIRGEQHGSGRCRRA